MVYVLDNPPLGQARNKPMKLPSEAEAFSPFQPLKNCNCPRRLSLMHHLYRLWHDDDGQDIAEYAVMLAVILVIVVGTIRLIGSNANNVFSNVASSIQ